MVFDARKAKQLQPGEVMAIDGCPGLRLEVSASRKSWTYRYRNLKGGLSQIGLGQWPDMGAPDAIAKWNEKRLLRDSGVDPKEDKKQAKQAAIAKLRVVGELTVKEVVEDYITDHILVSRGKDSAKAAERRLRAVLAEEQDFAEMPAKEVTRAVAFDVLERRKDKPTATAKLRGLMGGAWAHSMDAGRLDGGTFNWWPDLMKGKLKSKGKIIGGKHVGRSRRVLRDTEIGTLLGWMPNMHQVGQDCFVMYLWTATRGGEASDMRPEHLQREDGRLWWVIPKGATKNADVEDAVDLRVPLFGRALEVVERRLKEVGADGWLFTSRGEQYTQHDFSTYIYSLQPYSAKAASRARGSGLVLPVTHWTPHNLRRSARTLLAQLGCINEIGEAIVGHLPEEIVDTYNAYTYDAERLHWLSKLDQHLESLARQAGLPALP